MAADGPLADSSAQKLVTPAASAAHTASFSKRSKSVFQYSERQPDPGVNDYINKAFESINRHKKSYIGIGQSQTREQIDGVAMARARNKARIKIKHGTDSQPSSPAVTSPVKLGTVESRPIIEEPSPEEQEKREKLAKDLVELVELPAHLFEIKGEPVIKADASNDLVEKYLRDLEQYQVLVE